jgi:hypothetical protein
MLEWLTGDRDPQRSSIGEIRWRLAAGRMIPPEDQNGLLP